MSSMTLGPLVYSFFLDHLQSTKGLRPASIRSYRDGLRLFLNFVATNASCKISGLTLDHLTFDRVLAFLRHLEEERHNHIRSRNQRLALLHSFFDYLASRVPEMLAVAERVSAIPVKRVAPPQTRFLTREEVRVVFTKLPNKGRRNARDRALLLLLYNTGARVQEAADLRVGDLDLGDHPRVRLHGKGDKWRTCPLWEETARQLRALLEQRGVTKVATDPVFASCRVRPMTRFGIYKLVRRLVPGSDTDRPDQRVTPHVFRHTAAVHLLEAGVEINVIRGWLGHVSLDTTNRYAEISAQAKEAALRACEPPKEVAGFPSKPVWRNDKTLLEWLDSL